MEHDGVKLRDWAQVVPVGSEETSRLRAALAYEFLFTEFPAVFEITVASAPSEDVFSSRAVLNLEKKWQGI